MTEKKKIAISLRVVKAPNYEEKRDALSHDWTKIFEDIGLWPILIPNNLKDLEEFLNSMEIRGVIISGGDNIGDFPDRDKTEKTLIDYGIKKEIPILGVCRGMQIINRRFGGLENKTSNFDHVKTNHPILLEKKEIILALKSSQINVNSYHNNTIKIENLAEELESFAIHKEDNTVEGFLHKEHKIIGVMWHPEREINYNNRLILQKIFIDEDLWRK
jgi:putative glutamine amidotransferase